MGFSLVANWPGRGLAVGLTEARISLVQGRRQGTPANTIIIGFYYNLDSCMKFINNPWKNMCCHIAIVQIKSSPDRMYELKRISTQLNLNGHKSKKHYRYIK